MTTENYPEVGDLVSEREVLDRITELRSEDVEQFDNLSNIFVSGRKVEKIPSSSTDVVSTDNERDINYNSTTLFILLDTGGGVLAWRSVALAAF